jgi:predicted DNA-binding protein (MmcQ/YjbR family)
MNHDKRIKTLEGESLLSRVRDIAKRFPEVNEEVDKFGHTSFRVKDKPFVMMGENEEGPSLAIKTLKTTQYLLLQQKERFFKTAYIGQHGWTSLHTNLTINWDEIEGLIKEAYLQTAPKRFVKEVLKEVKK